MRLSNIAPIVAPEGVSDEEVLFPSGPFHRLDGRRGCEDRARQYPGSPTRLFSTPSALPVSADQGIGIGHHPPGLAPAQGAEAG